MSGKVKGKTDKQARTDDRLVAVVYARFSSDNQREESIEGQLRECKEYAERQGITILDCYCDRAVSGTTDKRSEFQRMIRDSERRQFDIVLVWRLDRFARSREDSATYRAILRRNGVKVVSAMENISEGPEGIMLEAMIEAMSEYFSAELSVKIKRGQKENALKCKANVKPPFGYRVNADRHYEVDPLTAPIALEMFTRYADGETVKAIADDMKRRAVFANHSSKYESKSSFHNLLLNRAYIGEYRYGGIVTPGGMPAIVPVELFERVQARMAKNRQKPAAMKADVEYILTTKLFCGKCGVMMTGISGTGRNGVTHYYYACNNAKRRKCDKKTVKKAEIERLVVRLTQEYVLRDEVIDHLADLIVDLQKRENTTLPFLQQQMVEIEKRIGNLLNAIEEGLATSATAGRLRELEEKKAELETAIAKERIAKVPLSREKIVFWISRFKGGDAGDFQYQKSLVDIFVNSVFLYEDKLVIGFNWKDGTKTVSLKDLEDVAAWGETEDGKSRSALVSGGDDGESGDADMDKVDKTMKTRASRGLFMGRFAPAHCGKSEFYRSPLCPVGGGFGFVRFMAVFWR